MIGSAIASAFSKQMKIDRQREQAIEQERQRAQNIIEQEREAAQKETVTAERQLRAGITRRRRTLFGELGEEQAIGQTSNVGTRSTLG